MLDNKLTWKKRRTTEAQVVVVDEAPDDNPLLKDWDVKAFYAA